MRFYAIFTPMTTRLGISLGDEDEKMLAALQVDIGAVEKIEVGATAVIRKLIRDEFERRKLTLKTKAAPANRGGGR